MSEPSESTGPAPHTDEAKLRFQVAAIAIVATLVGGLLTGAAALIAANRNSHTAEVQLLRTQQQVAYAKFVADHESIAERLDDAAREITGQSSLTVDELAAMVQATASDFSTMAVDVNVIQMIASDKTYQAARDTLDADGRAADALKTMIQWRRSNPGFQQGSEELGPFYEGTSGADTAMNEVFIPSAREDLGAGGP